MGRRFVTSADLMQNGRSESLEAATPARQRTLQLLATHRLIARDISSKGRESESSEIRSAGAGKRCGPPRRLK